MHICQTTTSDGTLLKATFCPESPMNLMSYSKGDIEVIDQKTLPLFEERMAGLGALIGPHFHHRPDSEIPPLVDENLFPFIKKLVEKGEREMFSHGIARYVPWKFTGSEDRIEATLSGADLFRGVKLSSLEGQDFEMTYKAQLVDDSLLIEYSFTKERPGVIGLHYYFALEDQKGTVESKVGPDYHRAEGWQPVEKEWLKGPGELHFGINSGVEADFGFRPEDPLSNKSELQLKTSSHKVHINYEANSEENAWQLYHPKEASYVCLEPVTAQDPRNPKLTSGHLKVRIKIY